MDGLNVPCAAGFCDTLHWREQGYKERPAWDGSLKKKSMVPGDLGIRCWVKGVHWFKNGKWKL